MVAVSPGATVELASLSADLQDLYHAVAADQEAMYAVRCYRGCETSTTITASITPSAAHPSPASTTSRSATARGGLPESRHVPRKLDRCWQNSVRLGGVLGQ